MVCTQALDIHMAKLKASIESRDSVYLHVLISCLNVNLGVGVCIISRSGAE